MNPSTATPTKKSTRTKFRVGVVSAITEQNDSKMLCSALDAMCSLGFSVSVLAEGDTSAQNICFACAEKYPRKFSMMESLPSNVTKVLEKSDVIVFPVSPDKADLDIVLKKGVVPVLPEGCGLDNFDAQAETGCAFTFEPGNIWSLVAALVRASENRRFSWDWKTLQQNLQDFQG